MSKFKRADKVELIEKHKGYKFSAFDEKYWVVIEVYSHGSITCIDSTHNLHFVKPSEIRKISEKYPVYYMLQAPEKEPEIDYKKAFEMMIKMMEKGEYVDCCVCLAKDECRENTDTTKNCAETIKEKVLNQCTKGGE